MARKHVGQRRRGREAAAAAAGGVGALREACQSKVIKAVLPYFLDLDCSGQKNKIMRVRERERERERRRKKTARVRAT